MSVADDQDVRSRVDAHPIRLQQILITARRLFFSQGFSATSMEAVARGAGIGKATLYESFPNKLELLRAVIVGERDLRADTLDLKPSQSGNVRAVLSTFAHSLVELLLSESNVALYRIISSEVPRHPELGTLFYENGPARIIARVADYFAELMEAGRLLPGNPRLVAAQFIGLIRADLQTRSLFGIDPEAMHIERPVAVESGIDAFLRAYGRQSPI